MARTCAFLILAFWLVTIPGCSSPAETMALEVADVTATVIEEDVEKAIFAETPAGESLGSIIPASLNYQITVRNRSSQDLGDFSSPVDVRVEPKEELLALLPDNIFEEGQLGYSSNVRGIEAGEEGYFHLSFYLGAKDTTGLDHGVALPPDNLQEIEDNALKVTIIFLLDGEEIMRYEPRD